MYQSGGLQFTKRKKWWHPLDFLNWLIDNSNSVNQNWCYRWFSSVVSKKKTKKREVPVVYITVMGSLHQSRCTADPQIRHRIRVDGDPAGAESSASAAGSAYFFGVNQEPLGRQWPWWQWRHWNGRDGRERRCRCWWNASLAQRQQRRYEATSASPSLPFQCGEDPSR